MLESIIKYKSRYIKFFTRPFSRFDTIRICNHNRFSEEFSGELKRFIAGFTMGAVKG